MLINTFLLFFKNLASYMYLYSFSCMSEIITAFSSICLFSILLYSFSRISTYIKDNITNSNNIIIFLSFLINKIINTSAIKKVILEKYNLSIIPKIYPIEAIQINLLIVYHS